MIRAATLVHNGAMPIAVHAIRSFGRHFTSSHRLEIHTDGSVGMADQATLLEAARGMEVKIVTPDDRRPLVTERLAGYPKTRELIGRGGYFTKLEMPMASTEPYFYFDSDIVWLRSVTNLIPCRRPNAFSTESWSWYNGVAHDDLWIEAKTPRRVNSGFYYLSEPFPFERLEEMLVRGMFDPTLPYNTDQEIMAYLFRDMEIYHPEDLKRSRVRKTYDLASDASAALHFPGQMWLGHLDQIESMETLAPRAAASIRYQDPVPLTKLELFRMRMSVKASNSPLLRNLINRLRALRGRLSGARV